MSKKNLVNFLTYGRHCPNCSNQMCGTIEINKGGFKFTKTKVEIYFFCYSCHKHWKETYELVDVSKCKEVMI